jgi:outer membrane protein
MMKSVKFCWYGFSLCLLSGPLMAQEQPLWELGIGAAALHLPYYRGSESARAYLLPYPYLIYRGEFLNIDEDGVRGWLYRSDTTRFDLSLAGGVPVPSDRHGPRRDMPDLNPTVEFGPSLQHRLWQDHQLKRALWLHLPLRAAYSVDTHGMEHEGWVFAPYLEYSYKSLPRGRLDHSISIGPLFADHAYHDYFYGVAPAYATADRPAYQGKGGYGGSRLTLMTQTRFEDIWLVAFLRVDTLAGAVFENSPLVQTRRYHIVGVSLTWILGRSEEMVYSP